LTPNEKIFGIKNSEHVLSYPKIKKNWSKSRFFNIVGGVLNLKNFLVKSEFFHRDQKITSLELELSNQLSCNHELEEQILELRNKLELNEIVKMRQNDLERSYERIKVDIARVTDERDEYRSLAESLKSHQTNTGLMEQSIAIGPIWPSSPSPIPIRSYGGSASNLMTQSCHPGRGRLKTTKKKTFSGIISGFLFLFFFCSRPNKTGLSGDSPANASPSCLPEGPAKEKDADDREHFQVGDSVLVIFNKDKKQYVLHTTGLRFYFVHEGCFEEMGLEKPNECTDTEICLEVPYLERERFRSIFSSVKLPKSLFFV